MKLIVPALALLLALPAFTFAADSNTAPPATQKTELTRQELIDIAEKEAQKAYTHGRSNGFYAARKPDGVVREISVEKADGNYNVLVRATLTVNGVKQEIGSVRVVLSPEGKRVGSVVFTGQYAPTTQPK